MTPALRKIHRYTWYSLAILLPLGWGAAILAIPDDIWQQPVRREQAPPLPVVVHSRQSGDLLVNLRQDSSGTRRQVEIFIQKPLTNPNTTVSVIEKNNSKKTLLGMLGARGVWRFNLDNPVPRNTILQFQFEDKLQGRILSKITFD